MSIALLRALLWGLVAGLYLRFGLEPTGWVFYEISHLLNADWLYPGYSVFRGGGYAFGLWRYQTLVCIGVGVAVALLLLLRPHWRKRT